MMVSAIAPGNLMTNAGMGESLSDPEAALALLASFVSRADGV
jgi:hypothetical protein